MIRAHAVTGVSSPCVPDDRSRTVCHTRRNAIKHGWVRNPCCRCALAVLLLTNNTALAATPQGARNSISTGDLRRHVEFLASDTLEGRAAGSQGGRAAAAYLAQQFRKDGLQPGADNDDFAQLFPPNFQNLLALLPGSDSRLQQEVIVVSGHFDHVGYGTRSNSFGPYGQIHNGADDNASGTAAVLEVAAAMAALDQAPRRSVLFALWDAEEGGMLGSSYWIKNPTLPIDDVRLMVNCDMVGRLRNETLVAYGARSAPGLRQRLAEANSGSDLTLNFDWRQRDDSDHWPFFRRHVPYIMLHTGDHNDYHRPSDDVDKVNFDGLERLSRLLFDFSRAAADADELPAFRAASLEERRWHQQQAEAPPAPSPPRLGLSWNGERAPGAPFLVTHIEAGSPAALAGLRVGDRIVSLAGTPASEIASLRDTVLAAPQKTDIEVERDGESTPRSLHVALRGNPARLGVSWREDSAEPAVAIVTTVVAGSPAAAAGIEPLDRLLPPRGETFGTDWLSDLAEHREAVLRRERRGRIETLTIKPLR